MSPRHDNANKIIGNNNKTTNLNQDKRYRIIEKWRIIKDKNNKKKSVEWWFKKVIINLFCQISDDDRMSLTTAVSEDDDGESVHNSPYKVLL